MKAFDFVISYIREEATTEQLNQIRDVLDPPLKPPPVNESEIISRLMANARQMKGRNESKLQIVKYVKDITGWGLKDCKDWVESFIKFENS